MTVNSLESPETVMDALNEVMNEGIVITAVTALPEKAVNAMTSVAAAEYLISFREGKAPKFDLEDTMKAFMEQPEIYFMYSSTIYIEIYATERNKCLILF